MYIDVSPHRDQLSFVIPIFFILLYSILNIKTPIMKLKQVWWNVELVFVRVISYDDCFLQEMCAYFNIGGKFDLSRSNWFCGLVNFSQIMKLWNL